MNEREKIRCKEAFMLMDENNSGMITIDDLHFLIRALGFTPTENDLKKIDEEFIKNGNRNIDYLWFIDLISTINCTKYTYEQIQNAFFDFDKNHYGLINAEEFKKVMMTMGEPLSENEMNEILKDLPVNEDGFIEYENFCSQFKLKDDAIKLRNSTEEKKL